MTDNLFAAAILDDPYIGLALLWAALIVYGLLHQAVKEHRAVKASRHAREVAELGREFAERRRAMAADRFARHRQVH